MDSDGDGRGEHDSRDRDVAVTPQQPVGILIVDDIESNLIALEALLGSPSVVVTRAQSFRLPPLSFFAQLLLVARLRVQPGLSDRPRQIGEHPNLRL